MGNFRDASSHYFRIEFTLRMNEHEKGEGNAAQE